MKMGKLFSSIATATMVLTTLAPAAVANAATGFKPATTESTDTLPAAANSSDNSNSGSATATSDATVNVIDGFLVLKAVPNFGFGVSVANDTVSLNNFDKFGKGNDGVGSTLEIVDSRRSAQGVTKQDGMGFNVQVALGKFSASGVTREDPVADNNKFTLQFNKFYESGKDKNLVINSGVQAKELSTATTIINAPNKESGGNHIWQFNSLDGRDAVKLSIPQVDKGQWHATMTWTLNAAPSAS